MYPTMNAEMARRGIKSKDVAEAIGVHYKTIRARLSGKHEFTNTEMRTIRDKFFPNMTIDALFAIEDCKEAQ